jgi:hypothetical protein
MGGGGEYKDLRVEQDIKVEVATSVDDHLGCEERVFPPATKTLQQVAAACTLLASGGQRRIRSRSLAGNALKVMCTPVYLQLFGEISKRSAGRSSCRARDALRNFCSFQTQSVDRMHYSRIWPTTLVLSLFALCCCCESAVLQSDLEALQALYASTNGTSWINKWTNITTTDPCASSWYGVACDDSNTRVTK